MKRHVSCKGVCSEWGVLLLAFMLCAGWMIGEVHAEDESPIVIASIFAHTGEAAEENSPNYLMTRLAAKAVNEAGGVLGRPIELLEIDNKSTAIGSHHAALQAVKAGAVAVVGPSWSSHALAMATVLQKAKIPMVGATTTAPEVTRVGDYIFRACYTNSLQAEVLARFAREKLGAESAGLLVVAGDAYSEDLADQFLTEFSRLGGSVLVRQPYLLSSMDFGKELRTIKAVRPDIVFVPGFARDSGLILKQARSMGITVPFLGGDGWTALEEYQHIGELSGENYYASHWHRGDGSSSSRDFLDRIRRYLGPDVLRDIDAGNPVAYDAMGLLVDAITRAGAAEPTAIRDALAETDGYQGVTGEFSFKGSRDPRKPLVILQISGTAVTYVKTVNP